MDVSSEIFTDGKSLVPCRNGNVANLPELASQIKQGHQALIHIGRKTVECAMRVGDWLIAAQDHPEMKHGQFLPWLETCDVPERTAQRYMKLAHGRALIETQSDNMSDLTMSAAMHLLEARRAAEQAAKKAASTEKAARVSADAGPAPIKATPAGKLAVTPEIREERRRKRWAKRLADPRYQQDCLERAIFDICAGCESGYEFITDEDKTIPELSPEGANKFRADLSTAIRQLSSLRQKLGGKPVNGGGSEQITTMEPGEAEVAATAKRLRAQLDCDPQLSSTARVELANLRDSIRRVLSNSG
jgi:hypothetical protein